jgi:hypothetical protein
VSTKDVVLEILEASHNLIGKGEWFRSRRKYLQRAPTGVNISDNEIWDRLMIEADRIIDILRPSETQSLLGFSRRRRQYFCPKCRRHASKHREEIPRLAQLNPNSPGSTNLYCFVCGTKADVLRVSCKYPDCKGNVIEPPMPYVLDYDYPPEFTEFERDGKKMARMRWREEDGSVEVIEGPMRPSKCLTCWRPQDDS